MASLGKQASEGCKTGLPDLALTTSSPSPDDDHRRGHQGQIPLQPGLLKAGPPKPFLHVSSGLTSSRWLLDSL